MSEPSYVVFDHRSDGANDIEAIGHDIAEPKAACFSSMLTLAETSRSGENAGLPCGALPRQLHYLGLPSQMKLIPRRAYGLESFSIYPLRVIA